MTTLGTDPMWKKRSYILTSDHNQVANKDKTPKEEAKTGGLTVGELREAIEVLPEYLPVCVWVDGTNRVAEAVEILNVSYEPDLDRLDLEIYLEEEK